MRKHFERGYIESIDLTVLGIKKIGNRMPLTIYYVECGCGEKYEIRHSGITDKIKGERSHCVKCTPVNIPKETEVEANESALMMRVLDKIFLAPDSLKECKFY